ncbi:beta-1,6-N-acetylglucosaminyltransferase [Vibrio splendidus]
MKIAFLCLAHNNYDYLSELSNYCCSDGDGFFLHLDINSSVDKPLDLNEKTFLLDDNCRKRTRWGTFEIVEATLELIKLAVSENKYDRYILISGSDLPLLNKYSLKLKLNSEISYFSIWDEVQVSNNRNTSNEFFTRHFYYSSLTNPGEVYASKNRFRIHSARVLNYFISLIPRHQNLTFDKYYKGSQWWCITNEMAEHIIIESTNQCKDQFKYMHAPDEKYFITLAMNSIYKKRIKLNYGQASLAQGLHYINWGWNSPKKALQVFNLAQVEEAKLIECAFARKIDVVVNEDYIIYLKSLY